MIVLLVQFRSIPFEAVADIKSKMSRSIRDHGSHLGFPIGPKNTNLLVDVEILLPNKSSANQRPGWPS